MVTLKQPTTRHAPEHQDGLALVAPDESNADYTGVATSDKQASAPRLSVVIPAMNEEGNIPALHRTIADILETTGITFELILVDDGSTDGTWQAIEALSA